MSRRSHSRKRRQQNSSEDQLICINLTGLDGLVTAGDSEQSVCSQGSEEEDYDPPEDEDYKRRREHRNSISQHRGADLRSTDLRNTRPPPPKPCYHCDPIESNAGRYYPQRGRDMSPAPQHVHTHAHPHHHVPPMPHSEPQPPRPPQHYQPAGPGGGMANAPAVAPIHTAVAASHQSEPPPTSPPGEKNNPIRHYSLNVTACSLGLEKLEAQFERKRSIIEMRCSLSLKTTEEKFQDDIENIARTLKAETEKCIQTCLPPGEDSRGAAAGAQHQYGGGSPGSHPNGGCFQTTMLVKSAVARELSKRAGTMPAWMKQA